ncbi:hypothetical protein BP5796_00207 [Coleophoma crateriformis]|uniref:Uncharacterized protein n=1 Tax=Coleophoma crateriformis TaxID=565419 RepID=A0A3D8T7E7_9HELO|nr:hypothetical protein BP5796_00207 [Coleophoma crateriformis]
MRAFVDVIPGGFPGFLIVAVSTAAVHYVAKHKGRQIALTMRTLKDSMKQQNTGIGYLGDFTASSQDLRANIALGFLSPHLSPHLTCQRQGRVCYQARVPYYADGALRDSILRSNYQVVQCSRNYYHD